MLTIPRSLQEDDYSCGAHCVKMLADYYGKTHPKTKAPYSLTSIKRMCKTTKEVGTEISDLDKGLKKLGLERVRTTLTKLLKSGVKKPILTLIKDDEPYTDHYVLINGVFADCMFSVIDPEDHNLMYIGETPMKDLVRKFDGKHWLWEIKKRT